MGEGGRRTSLVALGAAIVALAIPAVALAAANQLSISAPRHAKLNHEFRYSVSGNSAGKGNRVATFLTTGTACARTFKQELASPDGGTKVAESVAKGRFTLFYKATSRSTGTHHICAYLYKGKSKKTLKRTTHKYVTKP